MENKLDEYIYDESNGLWYQLCGDYYIPCLTLGEDEDYEIGKYGRMHRAYLKDHRPGVYTTLVMNGTLFRVLEDVERSCRERMEVMISAMKEQEGVTETLKAADQMEWVRRMNSIHNRAEEIVLHELVYDA